MERYNVEVPVSVGDIVYRTTKDCTIEQGIVTCITVVTKFYTIGSNESDSKREISFSVNWGCVSNTFEINQLNKKVFLSKNDLIKQIVSSL